MSKNKSKSKSETKSEAIIKDLTPEQDAALDGCAERWIQIGLSCAPMDVSRAIAAARTCYERAELAPPEHFIIADGPISGAAVAQLLDEEASQVGKGLEDPRLLEADMVASVARSLDQAHACGLLPWKPTHAEVQSRLRRVTREQVEQRISEMSYGAHSASWGSFVETYGDLIGLTAEVEQARGHAEIAKECGWWAPYDSVCILQQRHRILSLDDQGNLHSDTGFAVQYGDGWGLHAWHGLVVDRRLIEAPETITLDEIRTERNAEVRRVMRTRYGEGRYLRETGARLVDADYEGAKKGAAPRALLEDHEGQRFLVGTDGSTGRVYHMLCPREAQTCRQAHEVLCGFDETKIIGKS